MTVTEITLPGVQPPVYSDTNPQISYSSIACEDPFWVAYQQSALYYTCSCCMVFLCRNVEVTALFTLEFNKGYKRRFHCASL